METVNEVEKKSDTVDSGLEKETGRSQSNETPIVKEKRPFHSMIKWSFVIAAITTYTHFFGFSFVKGKLQAAGFYSSDISLDVNETLHEAAAATYKGLDSIASSFFSYETFQTAIFLAIMLPSAFLFVIGLRYLEKTSRIEKASNVVQSVKAKFQKKYAKVVKNTLVTAMLAVVGLMLPYLSVMLIVTVISIAWLGMSLGQNLGEAYTKDLIEKKVCKPLPEAKADIYRSCMAIQLADGSVLSGRILHQDQSQLFFLTNNGSYQINETLEVRYSACIHRVKEAMGPPSEIVTGCMARCEPSCQKESNEVNSPVP